MYQVYKAAAAVQNVKTSQSDEPWVRPMSTAIPVLGFAIPVFICYSPALLFTAKCDDTEAYLWARSEKVYVAQRVRRVVTQKEFLDHAAATIIAITIPSLQPAPNHTGEQRPVSSPTFCSVLRRTPPASLQHLLPCVSIEQATQWQ